MRKRLWLAHKYAGIFAHGLHIFEKTEKRTFPKPPASHPFSPSYREWCRLPKTVGGTVTLPFPLVVEDPRFIPLSSSEPSALSSGFSLSGCPGPAGDSGSPLLISGVGEPCWGGSDGSGLVHKSCITPFPTGFKDASKRVYLQGHWGNRFTPLEKSGIKSNSHRFSRPASQKRFINARKNAKSQYEKSVANS